MPKKNTPLIVPELVPKPLWGRSAFRLLGSKAAWTKQIRPQTLAASHNSCSMCKSNEGRMICHERWGYDDRHSVATLLGFEIHCSNCDLVAHAGRAYAIGFLDLAIGQLCIINRCHVEHALAILNNAITIWEKRSKKEWRIEVATCLVERYPELAGLPTFLPRPATY